LAALLAELYDRLARFEIGLQETLSAGLDRLGYALGDVRTAVISHPIYRSFGWARATGPGGGDTEAWLQTGESYAFTAAASI
jgi:hypothetical protein